MTSTETSDATAEPAGGGKKKKKKNKKASETDEMSAGDEPGAAPSPIEVRGRVFAAAELERLRIERDATGARTAVRSLKLEVPSARIGVKVAIFDWLNLVLEADFAGQRPDMRDGFLQAKKKHWLLRAGQFKMPISAFTLESPWTLPVARRGILHDILSDHMLLFGRREGFVAQAMAGGFWDPALTVGAFRSVQAFFDHGDPLLHSGIGDQTLVGRLSVTPGGVEIAATGQRRVTVVNTARDYWATGLEATGDFEFESTGVRFWAEAFLGNSWLAFDDSKDVTVHFVTARALGAFRWGGIHKGDLYLEPFLTLGGLDPDLDSVSDALYEVMAGVNLGHWKRTRLSLQFELDRTQRNFPRQTFLLYGKEFLVDHRAVVLEVGAAF